MNVKVYPDWVQTHKVRWTTIKKVGTKSLSAVSDASLKSYNRKKCKMNKGIFCAIL